MRVIPTIMLVLVSLSLMAQKGKVQAAWRSLNDYESTLGDNPDISYLAKAKEYIDIALLDDATKNQAKTHAYKCRIMYNLYQYHLKQEQKKLEASMADKNERMEAAYGAVPVSEFEEAIQALHKIKELDPKYFNNILEMMKGGDYASSDDDLRLSNVFTQLRLESSNIAVGKYKTKDFDTSADYFYKSASLSATINGKKDTSGFYNACISAQKAKNLEKMVQYNKAMIDQQIASAYNYQTLYDTKIALKDLEGAMVYLKMGRQAYPSDVYLMNRETEVYLQKGDQEKALSNLQMAIEKEPNNAQLQLVLGNVYDNLANPKGKSGKDTIKPVNYDELIIKAAEHYQKAIDLKPTNPESYFNALYNLGALYNNYGGHLYNRAMEKSKLTDLAKHQKTYEAQSSEYYKKAIPYLEQALAIKSDDKASIFALRKLYYLTGNEAKGKEMADKLKDVK